MARNNSMLNQQALRDHLRKHREIFLVWLNAQRGITANDKLHAVFGRGVSTAKMRYADRVFKNCQKAWRKYCRANKINPNKLKF